MKKATMIALISLLNGETIAEPDTIKAELEAELNRGAEKAKANRDLYAQAHDVVMEAFAQANAPVTIGELYEAVAKNLPAGMTKGKVQYAVTRLWADELVRVDGKVNTYTIKA